MYIVHMGEMEKIHIVLCQMGSEMAHRGKLQNHIGEGVTAGNIMIEY